MNEIVISASGKRNTTLTILISLFWQIPAVFATYIPETVSKERESEETNKGLGIAQAAVAAVTTIKGGTNSNDDKTTIIIIAVSSSLSVLALVLAALFFRSYMKKRLKKLEEAKKLKKKSAKAIAFKLDPDIEEKQVYREKKAKKAKDEKAQKDHLERIKDQFGDHDYFGLGTEVLKAEEFGRRKSDEDDADVKNRKIKIMDKVEHVEYVEEAIDGDEGNQDAANEMEGDAMEGEEEPYEGEEEYQEDQEDDAANIEGNDNQEGEGENDPNEFAPKAIKDSMNSVDAADHQNPSDDSEPQLDFDSESAPKAEEKEDEEDDFKIPENSKFFRLATASSSRSIERSD